MVKIDENGNKVNVWTESRIDTTTLEIVEVEHVRVLATAEDTEHWHSRIIESSEEAVCLNQPTLFVYGSEEVLRGIEQLLERVVDMCNMSTERNGDEVNIPLSALLRVMVGDATSEGVLLYKSLLPTGILTLLTSCDIAAAEQLKNTLFEIFTDIDYIEIEL
jgi:hypothetical protein